MLVADLAAERLDKLDVEVAEVVFTSFIKSSSYVSLPFRTALKADVARGVASIILPSSRLLSRENSILA